MQIVLSILQFLGWSLLIILALLLVVVLIILFHPVRYLIHIHWLEEQWAKFQAHWCFHLIRAKFSYRDDLIYGEIHLFGKKKTFSFDLTEEKEEKEDEDTSKVKEKKTKEASNEGIISKIKGMIERIKKIIADEKNQEAVAHLKQEVIYLLKVLLPKKSKIEAVFSTGSPDTTGQTFGVLACFPAIYQKNWKIIPDFESDELYLKGTIWGKGRIYGYEILGIILRIIFDKNCRRLYTIINKFLKWIKKSDKAEGNING